MKKPRPCLRCDRKFPTTPEWRICRSCRSVYRLYTSGALTGGIEQNKTFTKPKNTRHWGTE